MFSTAVANTDVVCAANELLTMQPSFGANCPEYLDALVSRAGGKLINGDATFDCKYCPIAETDTILELLSTPYSDAWRNLGLILVYIVFNVVGALVLYWYCRVPKKRNEKEKQS